MSPHPSKFEVLQLESVEVWADARTARTISEQARASAESSRLRSEIIRARVVADRTFRHAHRLERTPPV